MKMLGKNSAATSSEELTPASVFCWAISGAESVVFTLLRSPPGSSDNKKMSCYQLVEEGNVHLLSCPPSLPKESASQFIHSAGVFCLLAAFVQHPTVQGHVPGAEEPLAVLLV